MEKRCSADPRNRLTGCSTKTTLSKSAPDIFKQNVRLRLTSDEIEPVYESHEQSSRVADGLHGEAIEIRIVRLFGSIDDPPAKV